MPSYLTEEASDLDEMSEDSDLESHIDAHRKWEQEVRDEEWGERADGFIKLDPGSASLQRRHAAPDATLIKHLVKEARKPILLQVSPATYGWSRFLSITFKFPEFLVLVGRVRAEKDLRERKELWDQFQRYDLDMSGELDMKEIGMLLADVGLRPKTRGEQKQIIQILEAADIDGSGTFDFEEFQVVARKVREQLLNMEREALRNHAVDLGFLAEHFGTIASIFQALDRRGLKRLNLTEVKQVVKKLRNEGGIHLPGDMRKRQQRKQASRRESPRQGREQVSQEDQDIEEMAVEELFEEAGTDQALTLDFREFLKLLSMLGDREAKIKRRREQPTKRSAAPAGRRSPP